MTSRPTQPPGARLPPAAGRALAVVVGAAPVIVLGFQRGGFFPDVVASYAIAVWCLVFLTVLSGALAAPRPNRAGWAALGATAVLTAWGALSLGWSASPERGLTEVVRLIALGGTVVLGLAVVASGHARHLVGGVLAGLAAVLGASVLARLMPDLIPAAWERTAVPTNRLSWPVGYWNGLGAVAALALALAPAIAVRARVPWTSGAAVAVMPVALLALALTLSRGGIVAAAVGVALGAAAVRPRLVLLRTLVVPAIAGAVLIAVVWSRDAVVDAVGGQAGQDAGAGVVPLVLLATVGVAIVQALLRRADDADVLPRLPRPARRTALAAVGGLAVVLVAAFLVAGGPGRLETAWTDFKETPLAVTGTETSRLTDVGGAGRYDVWDAAWRAATENPAGGIGLGSWENWWSPRRESGVFARNAHSEPFELFAETGLLGLGALLVLLLAPAAGAMAVLRRRSERGPAAKRGRDAMVALPAAGVLVVAVSVDWSWQLSVVPVAAFLVCAPLLARRARRPRTSRPASAPRGRATSVALPLGLTALTIGAVAVSSLAMTAPDGVQRSAEAARGGRLDDAAAEARAAARSASFALTPVLQEAAVLERAGRLPDAAAAAREGTRREPRNWRPWLVLARIEAVRGRRRSALAAIARVRALNPSFALFRTVPPAGRR